MNQSHGSILREAMAQSLGVGFVLLSEFIVFSIHWSVADNIGSINPTNGNSGPASVIIEGDIVMTLNDAGQLHSYNDRPAKWSKDGLMIWYENDEISRQNGKPALISPDGTIKWYQTGQLHREGGLPAVIQPDGTLEYFEHGKAVDGQSTSDLDGIRKILDEISRIPQPEPVNPYPSNPPGVYPYRPGIHPPGPRWVIGNEPISNTSEEDSHDQLYGNALPTPDTTFSFSDHATAVNTVLLS